MKFKGRNIFLLLSCFVAIAIVAGGAWWGYRRYLSPGIEPSRVLYPTRGLDLSAHNGEVNFKAVKKAGFDFVMLKASEGISFVDKKFKDNYVKAREAGLRVGAYHFFRFDCDGRAQAYHFLNQIDGLELDFPPVFDVEEWGNPDGHDKNNIVTSLQQAIDHMELRDKDVMIYTNKAGYRKFISSHFSGYRLWICSFTDPPGPERWYMWQYTHRGRVKGVRGNVDINVLAH